MHATVTRRGALTRQLGLPAVTALVIGEVIVASRATPGASLHASKVLTVPDDR